MYDSRRILELAVKVGEVLLQNGGEIFRVQETMTKVAQAYHAEGFRVFVITTAVFASIEEGGMVYSTEIQHVPISAVHLGRVAAVNNLSREISDGKHTIEQALEELEKIKQIPFAPNLAQVLGSGIGSFCFCYIFGGSLFDCLAALISGCLLYIFVLFAGAKGLSRIMTNITGAAGVTLFGVLFFRIGLGEHLNQIVIGSIVPLLPGVPLTNAIRDFLNSDYLSGTIRLIDAVLVACCIAIGVGIVLKMFQSGGVVL